MSALSRKRKGWGYVHSEKEKRVAVPGVRYLQEKQCNYYLELGWRQFRMEQRASKDSRQSRNTTQSRADLTV